MTGLSVIARLRRKPNGSRRDAYHRNYSGFRGALAGFRIPFKEYSVGTFLSGSNNRILLSGLAARQVAIYCDLSHLSFHTEDWPSRRLGRSRQILMFSTIRTNHSFTRCVQ